LPNLSGQVKKVFVGREGNSPSKLQISLAGAFGVARDGTVLPDGEVGSRKARTLLKLLAVERKQRVSVERIIDALWGDEPPVAAERNVAALVSRLRAALGSGVIEGGSQVYRLGGAPGVVVDLDQATSFCDRAEQNIAASPAVALAAAERALASIAAGTALADEPYAVWADPAREEVRVLLRRARLAAAEAAVGTGDAQRAMELAGQAMTADPLDEQAHRAYMSAAAAAGERGKALAAYAALSGRLADELGTDPAPLTRELHLAILREQDTGTFGATSATRVTRGMGLAAAGTVLVGRKTEAETLRAAWRRAAGGEPGLVVIVGEAGIGKTTLAGFAAAEAAADGALVLRTRCYEAERSLFLQPIVEVLRQVVATLPAEDLRAMLGDHAPAMAAMLPDAAAMLGPPPQWRGSFDMERRRAFEAVVALLRGLARRAPVVLLVDDLQNAGESTVELLHYLGRHGGSSRLLALVTLRADHDARVGAALAPVASRVELGPLGLDGVAELARAAGQEPLTERILQRTGGHTLFVLEVLRALANGDTGVPDSLRAAITERVRLVGPQTEALLRAAAVLGATLDPLTLAALLGSTPASVLQLCELAFDARLVVVSGRDYEFANDLIREVLYATTPEPARVAYHRQAADLLTAHPESIAWHAAAAGEWSRAARAWLLAAEAAMRRYAATDAISLATQAIDAAKVDGIAEVAARAAFIRGRAHEVSGDHRAALADLTDAATGAKAAGDRRLEMLLLRELGGDVPASLGHPVSGYLPNLERGLEIAEALGDRAAQADLLARLAILAANRLRYDAALDYAARAAAAARAVGSDQALPAGLDGLKTVLGGLGDVAGLRAVLDEMSPPARRLGDLFRLQWVEFESAFVSVAAADWTGAAAAMNAGIEANRRGGYPQNAAYYVAHEGWLARLRGRDEEAIARGRLALELTERHPHLWWQAATCAMLGQTLLVTADRPGAIGLFERGLAAAEESGMEAYMLRCAAPLAAATGSRVVLDQASALLDAATFPAGGAWVLGDECYLSLARAFLACGEPDRAHAVLSALLTVAAEVPWIATLAAALAVDGQALARLGQPAPADTALRTAERLAREHGLPHVLREARDALGASRDGAA
jgi:DNA-binding SARP family transcriptional activator/tetratricopeptide (TPR) repeat protein